ncbi:hypothetical protein [Providencia hangzhouensis]|uniref:hypothetical protein n=1 Tax=Providencia hangzhouensis TaxID=3031799 RepID=UPI0034DD23CD
MSGKKQATAMGSIMVGNDCRYYYGANYCRDISPGIAWYAPFIYTAIGCLVVFIIGLFTLPHSQKTVGKKLSFKAIKHVGITRLILAKGLWMGISLYILACR